MSHSEHTARVSRVYKPFLGFYFRTMSVTRPAVYLLCCVVLSTPSGVYTPHQVLMAQAVGANYVAPYLGRMSDGNVGTLEASLRELPSDNPTSNRSYGMQVALETVLSMQAAVDKAGSSMRILVASIRQAEQMAMLAAHVSCTWVVVLVGPKPKCMYQMLMLLVINVDSRVPGS